MLVVDKLILEGQRLLDILRAAVRRAAFESGRESHLAFKAWIEKAVAKGARAAHAWVRRRNGETAVSSPLVLDGTALPSLDEVVATRSDQWAARWSTARGLAPRARLRLRELIGRVRRQDRDFATRETLVIALKRLDKGRGLGSDATEVPFWQGAPGVALDLLAGIFADSQRHVAWPAQTRWSRMLSIDKATGGGTAPLPPPPPFMLCMGR